MADTFSTHTDWTFLQNTPLNSQEQQIVKLRFGKGLTQAETGERLNLSQSAVSQKIKTIKDKLK